MMYRVLKPHFVKTGDVTPSPEGNIHWHRTEWVELGVAKDMADALDKFPRCIVNGYAPVLEAIGGVH